MKMPIVMIVDDEEGIRDLLSFYVESSIECEIIPLENGAEAIVEIEKRCPDLIICDYNMPRANGGEVFREIISRNFPTRFVHCSTEPPDSFPEFDSEDGLYGHILKPNLTDRLDPLLMRFSEEMRSGIRERGIHSYTPISIKLLLDIGEVLSDTFIKVSAEKYIKVYYAGDTFEVTDYVKFKNRNVDKLYLLNLNARNVARKACSKICGHLERGEASIDSIAQAHALMVDVIRDTGFSKELVPAVKEQIDYGLNFCKKQESLNLLLQKLLDHPGSYLTKHSLLMAVISVNMAKKLNWVSDITSSKLVICSLMHDIFLDPKIEVETERFYEHEDENFMEHPQRAAEVISSIRELPPDTERIILEQHEVGGKEGFPSGAPLSRVSPLGQLFSFTHFIVDYTLESGRSGKVDPMAVDEALREISEDSAYKRLYKIFKEIELY